MRKLKDIIKFAFGKDEPSPTVIIPPSPDHLAVEFAKALMISGRYESSGAAITAAWWIVPEFYMGRAFYQTDIAPKFFGNNPWAEPELTQEEARAMHDDGEGIPHFAV